MSGTFYGQFYGQNTADSQIRRLSLHCEEGAERPTVKYLVNESSPLPGKQKKQDRGVARDDVLGGREYFIVSQTPKYRLSDLDRGIGGRKSRR